MNDVEGKVAFVTGAASGIGLGMVRAFTRAGMQVIAVRILTLSLTLPVLSGGDLRKAWRLGAM